MRAGFWRLMTPRRREHFQTIEQNKPSARGGAEGSAAAICVCDVRLCDGRTVWARRHGDDERAGADAALSPVHPVFLVHSGFAAAEGESTVVAQKFFSWMGIA